MSWTGKETLNSGQLRVCRGFSRIQTSFAVYSQYLFLLLLKKKHTHSEDLLKKILAHLIKTK